MSPPPPPPDIKKAEQIMGMKTKSKPGNCFDNIAKMLLIFLRQSDIKNIRVVHGIGTANWPNQEGNKMGHAWIEFDSKDNLIRGAYDAIWDVATQRDHFHKRLKVEYFVEYGPKRFLRLWRLNHYPGPWDKKIKEVVNSK